MKKVILGLFLFFMTSSVFAGGGGFPSDKIVVLSQGWSTFSTPMILENISFSNITGEGISFYTLSGGTWESIQVDVGTIKPLEGYMVYNAGQSVNLALTFKSGVTPTEGLFSKNLNAGWNLLGVTSIVNPFGTIGSNATMAVDFTKVNMASLNYINFVTPQSSSYIGNSNVANLTPDYGESYAIFMSQAGIYGGFQSGNMDYSIFYEKADDLNDSNISVGSTDVTLLKFNVTNYTEGGAYLRRLIFGAGSGTTLQDLDKLFNSLSLNIYNANNDSLYSTSFGVVGDGTLDFDNLNNFPLPSDLLIPQGGSGLTVELKASFDEDIVIDSSFSLALKGADVVKNDSYKEMLLTQSNISELGPLFTFKNISATLSSSTLNHQKQLLLSPSVDQKIAAFKVIATNDNTKIKDIVLTGTGFNYLSNIRLADSNMNIVGGASAVNNNGAIFTYLDNSVNSSIEIDKSENFYVIANIDSYNDVIGLTVNINVAGSSIRTSNDSIIAMTGTNVTSSAHDITQNIAKIVQVIPSNKNIATDAQEFSVTAAGKNNVTLSSATFNNVLSGYDVGSVVLTVVRKSDNAVLGTASSTTGVVAFTANNIVDAGTTETYIVKLVGAVVSAGTTDPYWFISLTNLSVNTGVIVVDLADYPNNATTLPLSSTK